MVLRGGACLLGAVIEAGTHRVRGAVTAAQGVDIGTTLRPLLVVLAPPGIEIGLPLVGPHAVPTLRTTLLPGGEAVSLERVHHEEAVAELRRRMEANAVATADPWEWLWTATDTAEPRIQMMWPVRPR